VTILQFVSYGLGFEAFGVTVCSESLLNVECMGTDLVAYTSTCTRQLCHPVYQHLNMGPEIFSNLFCQYFLFFNY